MENIGQSCRKSTKSALHPSHFVHAKTKSTSRIIYKMIHLFVYSFLHSFVWLVGCLVDWLVGRSNGLSIMGWLAAWWICWLVSELNALFIRRLVDGLRGWPVRWSVGWFNQSFVGWSIGQLVDHFVQSFVGWLVVCLACSKNDMISKTDNLEDQSHKNKIIIHVLAQDAIKSWSAWSIHSLIHLFVSLFIYTLICSSMYLLQCVSCLNSFLLGQNHQVTSIDSRY